jgi:lipopolysaccharide export system protein LptA
VSRSLWIAVAATCWVSGRSLAQGPTNCIVQLDSVGGQIRQIEVAPGVTHQFANGGVWASCQGQPIHMRSDSAAWYSERNRVDFIGHVWFDDSTVTLQSQTATYALRDDRLDAAGDVHLVNRKTGSDLTGPMLTYWRAVPGVRDTAQLLAVNRPTVRYRAPEDSTGEAYVIVGQRVRLKGNDRAWASGNVTIDRSDFSAQSDSAELDLAAGGGAFVGHAQVRGKGEDAYTLEGRHVAFRLTGRELTWVEARGRGDARAKDWRLTADTIAFDVADRKIEHGTAWGDSLRPDARSTRYTMRADSVALDTPGQQLKEMRGYGSAIATAARDSLDGQPDWVGGDSLVATFDTTAGGQRTLSGLDAHGQARAYYRVCAEDGKTLAGINYSRGKRVIAAFGEKGIARVRVEGEGDGVYLEPDSTAQC